LGQLWDDFEDDFGTTLEQLWADLGTILKQFGTILGMVLARFWILMTILDQFRGQFLSD
jgi:hypothetical protein